MSRNKILLREGMKMLKRRRNKKDFHRFQGEPRDICYKIAEQCWNGRYFSASLGHFSSFYMRDFGMSVEALLHMGYGSQVNKNLEYILRVHKKHNAVTTTITDEGHPVDIFHYGSDSLPYLIRSLRIARQYPLIREYHDFLEKKVQEYYDTIFDEEKQIVKENINLSTMKDNFNRKSSLYANCFAAMLSMELLKLKENKIYIHNPFFKWNYKKVIKDRFWVGTHFLDDISQHHYIAADANTIPFFFDIYEDKNMLHSAIHTLIGEKLDIPIPAKYTRKPIKEKENQLTSFLAPNYQGDTCWTNLGLMYMTVVGKSNRLMLKKYIDHYLEIIEEHGNLLEVFDSRGKPYMTRFYKCDEGMLWSSMFFQLLDQYYNSIKKII